MANEVWVEEYDRLAELIRAHRTTLVFVNTRRLAERAARHLAERLGEDAVTSHHGSLAKEHRLKAEERLKAGRAQGARGDGLARARHRHRRRRSRVPARLAARDRGVPAARRPLGPRSRAVAEGPAVSRCRATTSSSARRCSKHPPRRARRDQAAALRRSTCSRSRSSPRSACRSGRSRICIARFTRAASYRDLPRDEFVGVARMVADGFTTHRGRRSAHLHFDRVNDVLRGRRGARAHGRHERRRDSGSVRL